MIKVFKMERCEIKGQTVDMIDFKNEDGQSFRMIIEDGKPRLVTDYNTLRECKQTNDFQPYIEVDGFYQD